MKTDFSDIQLPRLLIAIVVILLLLRFFPPLWGGLLFVLPILTAVGLFTFWWVRRPKASPKEKDQLTIAIREKIEECQQKAQRFRQEAEQIRQQHRELAEQMERVGNMDPLASEKASTLLVRFDNEMSLRLAKATIFETSLEQLNGMLENRRLQQQVEKSERDLEHWQQANFDDVAKLESMRERIRLDKSHLETISELAQRATRSSNLQQAVALQRELEKLHL